MRLSAAMRRDTGVYPGDGAVGRERATWCSVGQLDVASGGIDIADLGAFPGDDSLRLRIPNGTYLIEARLIDFNGSLCISRVRVRPLKGTVVRGRKRGQVSVDFGSIAIADFARIRCQLDDYDQDDLSEYARECDHAGSCQKYHLRIAGHTIHFIISKAGLGDGSYPVFSLLSRGRPAGLEVEFIRDGHELPKRRKGNPRKERTVDQARALTFPPAPVPPGTRRPRRHFFLTGEQTILGHLREFGTTTKQVFDELWASEARGGSAGRLLSTLVKAGKVLRTPPRGGGSSYTIAPAWR
jgi:hypothetical protein